MHGALASKRLPHLFGEYQKVRVPSQEGEARVMPVYEKRVAELEGHLSQSNVEVIRASSPPHSEHCQAISLPEHEIFEGLTD